MAANLNHWSTLEAVVGVTSAASRPSTDACLRTAQARFPIVWRAMSLRARNGLFIVKASDRIPASMRDQATGVAIGKPSRTRGE